MNIFLISGYWKDNPEDIFEDYYVTDMDGVPEEDEEKYFYFGLSEEEIRDAIARGIDTVHEFVITSYRR